ncbi:MAG TPA: hypothetical protein VMA95_18290 [Streptosporangiaceae bacterium]|nr:hypothetical protein [Streptosporangiaceae bacterium]
MSEHAPALVVGLGEVGGPLLAVLRRAHQAAGRDVEDQDFDDVEILHVCFPFGANFAELVSKYVTRYEPQVVVVHSTVLPGTTREVQELAGVPAVYSPVRGKHTRMTGELLRYRKFVAGTSTEAVELVERHLGAAGMSTARMSSFETLELAKLLETTYFGVLLAWAQEMDRFTSAVGADYWEAGRFFEEIGFLPPAGFEPGYIGGHCIMPNIDLLAKLRDSVLLDAVRHSNEERAREWSAAGRSLTERLVPRSAPGSG